MQPRWRFLVLLALSLALAATFRAAFAQVTPKVPEAAGGTTLSGTLSILWGDPQPGSAQVPQTLYFLTDEAGNRVRVEIDPAALAQAGGDAAVNGRRVVVNGALQAASPGSDDPAVMVAQGMALAPGETAGPDQITGSQPYVSILCKFNDVPDQPRSLTYFRNMYGASYPGLDHYWRETSFNNVNIVGSNAYGWFTLPRPRSYYFDGAGNLLHDTILDDCVNVANSSVNFPAFTGINMMFNADLDCCAWGGGRELTLDGVTKHYGLTWEPPWAYTNITVMSHEMGHSFGMPHSSGQYGYVYDNRWDVMSDTWTDCDRATHATYGCLGQGVISFQKNLVGWIPSARKFVAGATAQTITLERLVSPGSGNYLMAVIPIDGSSSHYYTVEARKQVGYDVKLPREGVVIHEVIDSYAYVIDADGNGDTGDAGGQWLPGETFYGDDGTTVTVESGNAAGYTITIVPNVSVTDPHEPNDKRADATRINYGDVIDDALIAPAGDVDVYRFSGAAGDTVQIDIDAWDFGSQLDSFIELMASNGAVLASNDDANSSLDSYLSYSLTAAGNYYVKVRELNHPNEGGSGYFYTLKVDTGAAQLDANVFVTAADVGTTSNGVSFDKRDILRWDGASGSWSRYLDGSALGLPTKADIVAIDIPGGEFPAANMAFAAPITVPGVGKVMAHDLLLYDAAGFSQRFDGSDVGLTLAGEKLDAFDILRGSVSPIWSGCERYILFSTKAGGSVVGVNNANLVFGGEDILGFCATQLGTITAGKWHKVMDGSNEGLPTGATFSLAASEDGQTIYLTTTGPFSTDGIAGDHSMIYAFSPATGQLSGPIWSAPDVGLPVKVDGMDLKPNP